VHKPSRHPVTPRILTACLAIVGKKGVKRRGQFVARAWAFGAAPFEGFPSSGSSKEEEQVAQVLRLEPKVGYIFLLFSPYAFSIARVAAASLCPSLVRGAAWPWRWRLGYPFDGLLVGKEGEREKIGKGWTRFLIPDELQRLPRKDRGETHPQRNNIEEEIHR